MASEVLSQTQNPEDEIIPKRTARRGSYAVSECGNIYKIPEFLTSQKFKDVLKEIDTFIFDADGVLWLGETVIPLSVPFIDYLINLNKQIIILTNNATKSRKVYAQKLQKLGYNKKLDEQNIVNPAAVVADLLYRAGIGGNHKKVYLIGGEGIKNELDILNIKYFGDGIDPIDNQVASKDAAFLYNIDLEENFENVGAVVVGYEKYFNYCKLMKAANYLQQNDCLFVATNEDETCPGPNPNTVIPDAGPLVAAVKVASGKEPIVVGKPNTPAFEYICRRWDINPQKTIMVGDRTNTDVKFGRDHGLKTMLVLSGCHHVDNIVENTLKEREDMVPDYYTRCLGSLLPEE